MGQFRPGCDEILDRFLIDASLSVSIDSRSSDRIDLSGVINPEDECEANELVPGLEGEMARNVVYYLEDAVVEWNPDGDHVWYETSSSESGEISLHEDLSAYSDSIPLLESSDHDSDGMTSTSDSGW